MHQLHVDCRRREKVTKELRKPPDRNFAGRNITFALMVSAALTSGGFAQAPQLWTYTGNEGGGDYRIREIALTSDASRIVTCAWQFRTDTPSEPIFAVWDFASGKQESAWQSPHWPIAMAISHDAKLVAALSIGEPKFNEPRSRSLVVFQASDGKKLLDYPITENDEFRNYEKLKFSPNNRQVFWLGPSVTALDGRSGKAVSLGQRRQFPGVDSDYAPATGCLVYLNADTLEIYAKITDFPSGKAQHQIKMPYQATECRLSADGTTVAISLTPNDGEDTGKQFIGLWDAVGGKPLRLYNCQWAEFDFLHNFVLSHDGKFVAGTHGRSEQLWIYDREKDAATEFSDQSLGSIGFTPAGTLIARSPGAALKFLDPVAMKIVATPLTEAQRTGDGADQPAEEPVAKAEPNPAAPMIRTWTSANGKFTVEASLVRIQDDSVVLLKKDGKVVTVPLSQLSANDRRFVQSRR